MQKHNNDLSVVHCELRSSHEAIKQKLLENEIYHKRLHEIDYQQLKLILKTHENHIENSKILINSFETAIEYIEKEIDEFNLGGIQDI